LVTEAHRCEQLAQGCYAAFAFSRIWTHNLLIASPMHHSLLINSFKFMSAVRHDQPSMQWCLLVPRFCSSCQIRFPLWM